MIASRGFPKGDRAPRAALPCCGCPDPDVDRRHVHHGRRLRNGIALQKGERQQHAIAGFQTLQGRFELFPQVAAFVFFFIEAERCLIGQAFRFVLFASGQRAERRFGPVAFAQPLVTAAQGNGRQPALKGTLPLVGTQAPVRPDEGSLSHFGHLMRQDVRGNEALHARPIGPQDGAERYPRRRSAPA